MIRCLSFIFFIAFTFSLHVYAGEGAGVLPIFIDEESHEAKVLIGRECRFSSKTNSTFVAWSDFGGSRDKRETLAQCAFREFKEETAHYSFPQISCEQISASPYVDHQHATGSYRMYFVYVEGKYPSIQELKKNAIRAKEELGANAQVEKNDWKYVSLEYIKKSPWNYDKVPGTEEDLYGPMKGVLRKRDAQSILKNFIDLAKTAAEPAPVPEIEIREVKKSLPLDYNPSPFSSSAPTTYEDYFREFLPKMGESCRAYNKFDKTDEEILAILFPDLPKGTYPDKETATKKFAELAKGGRTYAKLFDPPSFSSSAPTTYEDYFREFLPKMGESCRAYNKFDKTDEEILAILFPGLPKGTYPDKETATKKFAELAKGGRTYAKLFDPPSDL